MKALPGDVFLSGQLMPSQVKDMAGQGIKSLINNRPDQEAVMQPMSSEMEDAANTASLTYHHIPISGGIAPEAIEASIKAYAETPRPIVAFCGSGMRSAALWAFAHVDSLGVDAVMEAITDAGYNLEQLRQPLMEFAARDGTC